VSYIHGIIDNGNWVDNVIIWYLSVMHQNQQYHSASLQWLHIWNQSWVTSQDSGVHHLHSMASDIPLRHSVTSQKSLSGYLQRTPRSPVASCTLPTNWAEHSVQSAPSFTSTPPHPPQICSERNCDFQNRCLAFPKTEKPVLQKEPGFGNPRC